MPTLLNVKTSPHKGSRSKPRLTDEGRANILFQAHLTSTSHEPPKNFSPKVIRKAALCSPRHFLDEKAAFRSVTSGGGAAKRREVLNVHVSKKKRSMLATVKTKAPMVEVVTKRRSKERDLKLRGRDYDRKYETSQQREKKEFISWLDKLGTNADPGIVPMDRRYRKTLEKAVRETSKSKERSIVKSELTQMFNSFLLAGAGQHEYLDLANHVPRPKEGNEDGFVPSSPIYKPSVALRDGTSVKEHLLNCNRMFDTLRSISFNETVLAKGRKHAEKHGMKFINLAQFEEWWRFGCLSAGCQFTKHKGGHLQFDLSAGSKATRVWWKSHKIMLEAIAAAPKPNNATRPPRNHSERARAAMQARKEKEKLDAELQPRHRRMSGGASAGIAGVSPRKGKSSSTPQLALPQFMKINRKSPKGGRSSSGSSASSAFLTQVPEEKIDSKYDPTTDDHVSNFVAPSRSKMANLPALSSVTSTGSRSSTKRKVLKWARPSDDGCDDSETKFDRPSLTDSFGALPSLQAQKQRAKQKSSSKSRSRPQKSKTVREPSSSLSAHSRLPNVSSKSRNLHRSKTSRPQSGQRAKGNLRLGVLFKTLQRPNTTSSPRRASKATLGELPKLFAKAKRASSRRVKPR